MTTIDEQPDRLMDTDDVATYLKVYRKTVINMIKRGELAGYHVGKNWRIKKSDVDAYLESKKHATIDLESQVRTLCNKLLEIADEEALFTKRNALYRFVEQFPIGQKLIEEREM